MSQTLRASDVPSLASEQRIVHSIDEFNVTAFVDTLLQVMMHQGICVSSVRVGRLCIDAIYAEMCRRGCGKRVIRLADNLMWILSEGETLLSASFDIVKVTIDVVS